MQSFRRPLKSQQFRPPPLFTCERTKKCDDSVTLLIFLFSSPSRPMQLSFVVLCTEPLFFMLSVFSLCTSTLRNKPSCAGGKRMIACSRIWFFDSYYLFGGSLSCYCLYISFGYLFLIRSSFMVLRFAVLSCLIGSRDFLTLAAHGDQHLKLDLVNSTSI